MLGCDAVSRGVRPRYERSSYLATPAAHLHPPRPLLAPQRPKYARAEPRDEAAQDLVLAGGTS